MKRHITLLMLVGLFFCNSIYAKHIIGHIASLSDSTDMQAVTVKVMDTDSTFIAGTTTNSKGYFSVNSPFDNFIVQLSFVGYHDKYLNVNHNHNKEIDLGNIFLASNSQVLSAINITGKKISYDISKTIAYASHQQQMNSTNGLDFLDQLQLPKLNVNPILESITIDGTSGVILKINDIIVTTKEILAINPKNIDHIEYQDHPNIRELDSNSGVINFIVKKRQTGTYLKADYYEAFNTGFLNGNLDFKTVLRNSQFTLNYFVGWRSYNDIVSNSEEYYFSPTDTTAWDLNSTEGTLSYNNHDIYARYDYQDSINSFSIKLNSSLFPKRTRHTVSSSHNPLNNEFLFTRYTDFRSKKNSAILDLYYIHKYDKDQKLEINLNNNIAIDKDKNLTADDYTEHIDSTYNKNNRINNSLKLEGYYQYKTHSFFIDGGAQMTYNYTRTHYNSTGTLDTAKVHWFNFYPFASITGKLFSVVDFTVGTGIKYSYSKNEELSSNFCRNISSLRLFYKREQWNLTNMLKIMPSYPSLNSLNSVVQNSDTINASAGNVNLKPYTTIDNNISFIHYIHPKIYYTINFEYTTQRKPIEIDYSYDSETGNFVTQPINQEYNNTYNPYITLHFKDIFNIFNIKVQYDWCRYHNKGKGYDFTLNNSSYGIKLSGHYKKFRFNGNYFFPGKSLDGQKISKAYPAPYIDLQYTTKNFFVGLSMIWIGQNGDEYDTQCLSTITPYHYHSVIEDDANLVCIHLTYTFAKGKSIFDLERNID